LLLLRPIFPLTVYCLIFRDQLKNESTVACRLLLPSTRSIVNVFYINQRKLIYISLTTRWCVKQSNFSLHLRTWKRRKSSHFIAELSWALQRACIPKNQRGDVCVCHIKHSNVHCVDFHEKFLIRRGNFCVLAVSCLCSSIEPAGITATMQSDCWHFPK